MKEPGGVFWYNTLTDCQHYDFWALQPLLLDGSAVWSGTKALVLHININFGCLID